MSTGREGSWPRTDEERDALLRSLTEDQREAVYQWLRSAEWKDESAAWLWEHAWLPDPGTFRR